MISVRTNGLLALGAVVASAIVTHATLTGLAQDPEADDVTLRCISISMKVLLTASTIAVGTLVLAFEILGLRRERLNR